MQVVNGTTSVSKKFSGQLSLILHIESVPGQWANLRESGVSGSSSIEFDFQRTPTHLLASDINNFLEQQDIKDCTLFNIVIKGKLASLEAATLSKIESVQGRPS